MCITQLKTLSFSNALPLSDSLLFFGNYGLVGLWRAGQGQAWDNPKMETGTALGHRPAWQKCSKKRGIRKPQSCCDTDVLSVCSDLPGTGFFHLHSPFSTFLPHYNLSLILPLFTAPLKWGIHLQLLQLCRNWLVLVYIGIQSSEDGAAGL